ncbi:unnamed protein product [Lasius platythorax]|uniref:Uncharacterized protein n=1 Tax=Lasius platythorax TaxID=488582 RepID=A0AAV2MZV4_9HYME
MVEEYLRDLQDPTTDTENETEEAPTDVFLDLLESLTRRRGREFQELKLHNIAMEARLSGNKATLQKMALYLKEVFPASPPQRRRRTRRTPSPAPIRKRKARRQEYWATQSLWKRDRHRCISGILDQIGPVKQPPKEIMEPYWTRIFTTDGRAAPPSKNGPNKEDIWTPITEMNIKMARIPRTSAPCPDGVSARLYRSIPTTVILRLFNLLM